MDKFCVYEMRHDVKNGLVREGRTLDSAEFKPTCHGSSSQVMGRDPLGGHISDILHIRCLHYDL